MNLALPKLTLRQTLILVHDLLAIAFAIVASFYLRFEDIGLAQRWQPLLWIVPGFTVYAGIIFYLSRLHEAKWRFTSLPELSKIVRVSTILALSLLVLDYVLVAPNILGTFFFGKTTILLYWVMQIFFLSALRIAYRYFRYVRTRQSAQGDDSTRTLLLGRAADTEALLRGIESGAVKKIWPVGILSPSPADRGQSLRGIPVLGGLDDMERIVADAAKQGRPIARVVLTPSAFDAEVKAETIVMKARRLNLAASRLPSLEEAGEALRLAPINVEDLLLRPSVKIDYRRLEAFIQGKAVVVTGGGGSIGSEICDRAVTFGAARLLVIEHSEVALHKVLEALAAKRSLAKIEGHIADIRDRERMLRLISAFAPDLVFHAAALKHVPLLEKDWSEGVRTNVVGSVNVADAAASAGATAMVMISTDKAIEPVSVLGATKRLAEMYCQALDAELSRSPGDGRGPMRLIAVRFGNVLASNGSVVPKFKAQIESGGPVTVTHPDMLRYFMTIREACDLVITAATHALGPERSDVSVYVLNMGQPVKIVDLAERMITLSGLEPRRDIDIVFTGIRPGERMNEILFARDEPISQIGIEGIVAAKPMRPSLDTMRGWLAALERGLAADRRAAIDEVLQQAVPGLRDMSADQGDSSAEAVPEDLIAKRPTGTHA